MNIGDQRDGRAEHEREAGEKEEQGIGAATLDAIRDACGPDDGHQRKQRGGNRSREEKRGRARAAAEWPEPGVGCPTRCVGIFARREQGTSDEHRDGDEREARDLSAKNRSLVVFCWYRVARVVHSTGVERVRSGNRSWPISHSPL